MLSFQSLGTNHDELFLGFCRTVRCLGLRVGAIWPLGRGEQMWELRRFRAYRWSAWIEVRRTFVLRMDSTLGVSIFQRATVDPWTFPSWYSLTTLWP